MRTDTASNQPPSSDHTLTRLGRASWLVGMVAKQMVENPDGRAQVELSAGLVGCIKDFIADEANQP
jgi:hypothetical protein